MAQRWKTFNANTTLPASDINDCLNPSTAEHIPRAVAVGTATVASIPASGQGSLTVNFPVGRFSATPNVTITPNGSYATAMRSILGAVSAITATGFTITAYNTSATAFTNIAFNWQAVQM